VIEISRNWRLTKARWKNKAVSMEKIEAFYKKEEVVSN
jgi:hypothetical protein